MGALSAFEASADQPASLGIAGVGLIGGSIALAARRAWPGLTIAGLDRPDIAARARVAGVIDRVCENVDALASCDLIVLASPITEIAALVDRLATLRTEALVTDVGSTKRRVMGAAERAGLDRFVGGHPMAGAAVGGLDNASADLFHARPWILVPTAATAGADLDRLREFVASLGAAPKVVADADLHDRSMAYVSHLPQMLAVALMNTAGAALGPDGLALAGPAFREMTRLAASDGALWGGILADNADHVAGAAAAFRAELARLSTPAGAAFAAAFSDANAWRRAL